MNLLVVPQRASDEGPLGFRYRLATANLLSVRDLEQLEASGEIESSIDDGPTHIFRTGGAFTPWVRRWSRLCPHCVGNRQCWLIGWELLFADACAECGSWLIDTCNDCTAAISWNRDHLLRCGCGKYFSTEHACAAPTSVVHLSQALQCVAMGERPTMIPVFQGLNLGQCVRLIRLLGAYGNNNGYGSPQKVHNIDKLAISWPITSMAAEILVSWPVGFTRLLDNLRRHGIEANARKLSKAFRGFYSALYRGFKDIEFDFLRAAFENYVVENWTGAIGKRNRRLDESVLEAMTWIPANHACRTLHISRRRLSDLIRDGHIQGQERWTAAQRRFVVVKRSDVERLAESLDKDISLLETSVRLGLKKQRLLALLPIICPQAKKLGAQGCPWAIPGAWISRWETLIKTQMPIIAPDANSVSLGHLIRYWPWTNEQIGQLLVGILNGDLKPAGIHGSGNGIGTLMFYVAQLEAWFSEKQHSPRAELTLPDAALHIGVKQEVVYALVRSGLLQAVVRKIGRRSEQRVNVAILDAFTQQYVFGREIAQLLGRSPRTVLKFLKDSEVQPVAGPGVDDCRQIVFRRDEVDACLRSHGF